MPYILGSAYAMIQPAYMHATQIDRNGNFLCPNLIEVNYKVWGDIASAKQIMKEWNTELRTCNWVLHMMLIYQG